MGGFSEGLFHVPGINQGRDVPPRSILPGWISDISPARQACLLPTNRDLEENEDGRQIVFCA